MKKTWKRGWQLSLLAVVAVPLDLPTEWKSLSFKNIPKHEVVHSSLGLTISVDRSAGPVVHRFRKTARVKSVRVVGRWSGSLKFTGEQGSKKNDDSVLRVGFVVPGERRLNFVQKKLAPQWVLDLHALAPEGAGVDRIEFLCVANEPKLKGRKRTHPLSDLLHENFVWQIDSPQDFDLRHTFDIPIEAAALWLATDGDDTGSKFQLQLSRIELEFID